MSRPRICTPEPCRRATFHARSKFPLRELFSGSIVNSDQAGRTRYTTQYKQEVVAAFESSILSAPDFARQCGMKYPAFAA
jgi:hypothetical protein